MVKPASAARGFPLRLPTASFTPVPAGHRPKLWDGHTGTSAQNLAEIATSTLRTLLHLSCPATLHRRVHRRRNAHPRPRCMERAALRHHDPRVPRRRVTMTQVERPEQIVEQLSPDELATFRALFIEFDAAARDCQMAIDSEAGKLDRLAQQRR